MSACSSVLFKQILKLMERKVLNNELSLEEEEVEVEWSGEDGHTSLSVQMQIKGRHMHVGNIRLTFVTEESQAFISFTH